MKKMLRAARFAYLTARYPEQTVAWRRFHAKTWADMEFKRLRSKGKADAVGA